MFSNTKEGTIKFQDCEMDYLVFGSGTRPLVIAQGLNITTLQGGSWVQPKRYKLYGKHFRVYMIDRRRPLPEEITVKEIADDMVTGLKALGVRSAYVMGNSQGGMIAQYLALNYPKLVEKLVLNVTTSTTDDPLLVANVRKWSEMAANGDLASVSSDMTELFYYPETVPKSSFIQNYRFSKQKKRTPEEFRILTEGCLTCETYDRLGEIKCPVRVMGGKQDAIISSDSSRKLAQALGVEPMLFDGLGHRAYETEAYQKEVLKFLLD